MGFGYGSKKRRIEEARRNHREAKRIKKLAKKNVPTEPAPSHEPAPEPAEAA